ncbi:MULTISPECIES: 16S rRNA (cytidine(1402)-2'-O)-methyltransferase [Reinekea]|jgi:16S rRNA (cytidine1402-2'-O)-methyltransferase|uniref:16S rRNA (cytidine(1402)-2'-O)-methyltransferase n=1 Tax=Reinekea TaxID=230494 RepID=UPI002353FD5E|nr:MULTISPECIES: 16S rRNA (cytidine(1402)-2'-O)-methyltransferase [Reinekea]MDO7643538.1 16S rRNA (cytidine(1402)-2'-O)-methyltransferase [Reinekea forsetii]
MNSNQIIRSTLYVVATPIGNLADISERAQQVLRSVDLICCEDTRHSARLMDHLGCTTPLLSLHEHNERDRSAMIVERLQSGQSIALVSDAGTPLISDPGYVLVNHVIDAQLQVVPIPGASAVITALSISGLPTDRWRFEGFLPSKTGARLKILNALATDHLTLVFYESSHRIEGSLADMAIAFGADRPIVVARELTKTFETVLRGTIADVQQAVAADNNQRKGEFVVLVQGVATEVVGIGDERVVALVNELTAILPPKKAAAIVAKVFGGSKKLYYEYIVALGSE